jgi:hypothetical protein
MTMGIEVTDGRIEGRGGAESCVFRETDAAPELEREKADEDDGHPVEGLTRRGAGLKEVVLRPGEQTERR